MEYSKKYAEEQVLSALDASYHDREQRGVLTAAVTTKFGNDASSRGVVKLQAALSDSAHLDHAAAVLAYAELTS